MVNSRRADHAADTRRALVHAARRLISRQGYTATSLDEVCARARVTKGALYHHFRNKEELFVAVLDDVEADFVQAGTAAVTGDGDVWDALQAAATGFLEICSRDDTRRIVVEAPAVLGWERCRDTEHRHALSLLRAALEQGTSQGLVDTDNPATLAQLLVALFNEAGMIVAQSPDPNVAREHVARELDRVMSGLRTQPTTLRRAAARRGTSRTGVSQ